jgi:hypothetical protein
MPLIKTPLFPSVLIPVSDARVTPEIDFLKKRVIGMRGIPSGDYCTLPTAYNHISLPVNSFFIPDYIPRKIGRLKFK